VNSVEGEKTISRRSAGCKMIERGLFTHSGKTPKRGSGKKKTLRESPMKQKVGEKGPKSETQKRGGKGEKGKSGEKASGGGVSFAALQKKCRRRGKRRWELAKGRKFGRRRKGVRNKINVIQRDKEAPASEEKL